MAPMELVELMKKDDPRALEKIPDRRVARIVRVAFAQIGKQIDAANEGVVIVPGFGVFRARQVEREKDGQKVTLKLIVFRRAKAAAEERKLAAK